MDAHGAAISRPRTLVPLATLATLALLALLPASGQAQSAQRVSIQASGLYVGAYGTAYEGLNAGGGFEAQVRFTPSVWSIGAGIQGSIHSLDDTDLGDESVVLAGVFVEPRRVFDTGSTTFAPYISARLAYLRQSLDVDIQGETISASANGTQVNAGGGVLLRVSPRVNLDLGATYGLINFSDVDVTIPGVGRTSVDGTSGNGQNLVVRVGLSIGLR